MPGDASTQVYYVDDVGWVMSIDSPLTPSPVEVPLPDDEVVRIRDADGREALLQLVDPHFRRSPAPPDLSGPSLEPLAHPVAVTAWRLRVEVPARRHLSFPVLRPRHRQPPSAAQKAGSGSADSVTLLDSVTFAVEPGELVAIIGPSGAGKSTLVRTLIGEQAFCSGLVTYNSQVVNPTLPETVDVVRHLLGYVPQDDTLHRELRLQDALLYSARLRLPHLTRLQQQQVTADLLAGLGLADRAAQPLRLASGGERKRASVATELLTCPAVLYFDEPTTGLDPDIEESLLRTLKDLAHRGRRALLMVTHSIPALEMADKVLVIAGGRVAYVGSPTDALSFFAPAHPAATPETTGKPPAATHIAAYPRMYRQLRDGAADWAAAFERSPAYQTNVEDPYLRSQVRTEALPAAGNGWANRPSQFLTLAHRNISVIRGASGYALLLLLQAPALLGSLLVFLGWDNLSGAPEKAPRTMLVFLVFSAVAVGLVNSCREIVKELPIYGRERTVGLSIGAYLLAKFGVLAALCLGQSLVLSVALFNQGGPSTGLLIPWRIGENWLLLWVGMLATASLGLLISALARSDVRAQVMIPIVLVLQLLFTGALLDVQKPVIQQLSYVTGSYWLFSGAAASNDLVSIDPACLGTADGREVADSAAHDTQACSETWSHEPMVLVWCLLILGGLTVTQLALAGAALRSLPSGPT